MIEGIPDRAEEIESYIRDVVLRGIDLDPTVARSLLDYMNERHGYLLGTQENYFVLGSYEPPFRYRLNEVLDVLNRRIDAYAYFLVTQPEPAISDRLPETKLKFHLHALYADWIVLVLEHDTGGALIELGRTESPTFFDRTFVLPRAREERFDGDLDTIDDAKGRAIETRYTHLDVNTSVQQVADAVDGPLTANDLTSFLVDQFGNRRQVDYSGVLTDGLTHYVQVGRCLDWTLGEDLRDQIGHIP